MDNLEECHMEVLDGINSKFDGKDEFMLTSVT
jgi:hypothetical protein